MAMIRFSTSDKSMAALSGREGYSVGSSDTPETNYSCCCEVGTGGDEDNEGLAMMKINSQGKSIARVKRERH